MSGDPLDAVIRQVRRHALGLPAPADEAAHLDAILAHSQALLRLWAEAPHGDLRGLSEHEGA